MEGKRDLGYTEEGRGVSLNLSGGSSGWREGEGGAGGWQWIHT